MKTEITLTRESEIALHNLTRLRAERGAGDFALAFLNTYDPVRAVPDLFANPEHARVFLSEWCEMDWDLDWGKMARHLQLFRDDLRKILTRFLAGELPLGDLVHHLDHKLAHRPWIAHSLMDEGSVRLVFAPAPQLKPVQHIEAVVVRGLADLLAGEGAQRLRLCTSRPCEEIFVDRSKSGRQRFCGKRCATRFNVAMFRKRKAS